MKTVFKNHIVICGWNARGKKIVELLKTISSRPILIVHTDLGAVVSEIGSFPGVFTMNGDASDRAVLLRADVDHAYSVLVLTLGNLGTSADAHSVQIALAVERIKTSVYTVIELQDLQNKSHFAWTKVDDLVSDQEISVRLLAQGVRHLTANRKDDASSSERLLLGLYRKVVDSKNGGMQLFRIELDWLKAKNLSFSSIMRRAAPKGVLPLAIVGFKKHHFPQRTSSSHDWVSWKSDVYANPPANLPIEQLWQEWPEDSPSIGVIVLAKSYLLASSCLDSI